MWRRNFSSRAQQLSGGNVLIISIPKSGRTWVRAFLSAYFSGCQSRPFALDPWLRDETIPRLIFTHDAFEHRTKGNVWDWIRGKYLVPAKDVQRARVILLVRDPRDVFVSYYAQLVHRSADTPAHLRGKSVGDLLRHRAHGIISMTDVMNDWLAEFGGRNDFALFRYEDFRVEPRRHFASLLQAIGEKNPQPEVFEIALQFSDFENMKKLEADGAFDSDILRPGDISNPESFKVRRGKVGGFEEELSGLDKAYAAEAINRLDPRFKYGP